MKRLTENEFRELHNNVSFWKELRILMLFRVKSRFLSFFGVYLWLNVGFFAFIIYIFTQLGF